MSTGTRRHAILQVRWGPLAYQKTLIEPGQVLKVGRAPPSGLAVPQDAGLAEVQFELSWSGKRGWLHGQPDVPGTLLDGEPVEQGEIFNGSWLRAGQTDFSVYFEKTTPPREPGQPDPPVLVAHKAQALEVLRAQEAPLYALVDAARSERILELLHESVEDCYSLYEGPRGVALAEVAPYLVSLPRKDSWLLEALVQEGWGAHWGVFLTSAAPARLVRRHFRKFLMVEAEGVEGRLYFRYYDPRVLGAFLPSCPPGTREEFFGDIEGFIFSGSNGEVTVELPSLDGKRPPGRNGTRG
ncbi:hypothetical protein BO221_45525 [Archangium sp. Cb G35]|uniref:DUF4123 domain-containing protein n=1 Tax=Archangium sp. Cb G35 TaxID=1920190 RepID=UPI000936BD5F|nr:DUF4123 domain-containing protein [Archangium sp. Cb G35]OJT17382.1 hypothetical protein BO221_45525 [Archangium sp. Cb G35]